MSNVIEAFLFPFRNSSMKMLIGLVILYLLQYFIAYLPVFGLLTFLFIGYIYATQFKIIFTSANGYTDAPEFPDFGDLFDNVLIPLIKVILVSLISFAPLFLYEWQSPYPDDLTWWLLCMLGFAYMPLGLMIVAMDEVTQLVNPVLLFNTIRSAGLTYVTMVFAYAGFFLLSSFLEEAFAGSWILGSTLGAYGILFNGRLIGSVYRDRLAHQELEFDDDNVTDD